jgi:excisionase family DNA binding protein
MIDSPYLTVRETIAYLRLSSNSALYRLIHEQRLPFCRRGRQYLFDRREIDAWLHGHASALDAYRASRRKVG